MLTASWRSWYAYDMRRNGPQWLQWVWTFLFSMLMATGFTLLGFALYASGGGAWRHWTGWWHLYSINMVVALCIGYSIHGLFWLAVPLMGRERIGAVRGLNRLLLFAGVPLLGTAIGWPMAAWLVGQHGPGWLGLGDANTITGGMLVALLITAVLYQWFASKTRQAEAETRATEAQLRLL